MRVSAAVPFVAPSLFHPIFAGAVRNRLVVVTGASVTAVAVVGRVGEGAGREGEDEDLKHKTIRNLFFSIKLRDKMNCTVRFGNSFLRVPLV